MKSLHAIVAASLLTACGPKVDPLLPMKAELAAARKAGPATHPHAQFALASSSALTLVEQAVGLDQEQVVPLGMGAAVKVKASLDNPRYRSASGRKATHAEFQLDGRVSATVSSILGSGKLADRLGFSGTIGGGIRFGLSASDNGQLVKLMPVQTDRIKADVRLAAEKGPLTNDLVNKQLDTLLRRSLGKPLVVGRVPSEAPLRLSAMKLLPSGTPLAGLWLRAAPIDAPVPNAAPDAGWTLTTSDEAVLAASRAAFAQMKQHRTWRIEPRQVAIRTDGFDAIVRVHKVARTVKYRDYRIDGTIELGERLLVTPVTVEEIAKQGFRGSLIGPFVKGQVRRRVRALAIDRDADIEQPIGKRSITWRLEEVRNVDDGVAIDGSISVKRR